MDFVKTVMFLGIKRAWSSKDSANAFNVDLYVPGGDPWQFYVRDEPRSKALLDKLMRLNTGTMVDASFRVGKNSKGTYIVLDGIDDAA